mgnify:CR=1 FL=1|tara:strand:- start:257 stop:406 length:150 start_codon:yes stop_codon:yes gene_type:complete
MNIRERIKFILNGNKLKELEDGAYKRGYDACFKGAMKYLNKQLEKEKRR